MTGQTVRTRITRRRARWLAGALGLLLALGLVGGGVPPVAGQIPAQPMGFAGMVSTLTPAGPVPAGTLVQAYVGTQLRGEVTTGAGGVYDNLLVPGPGGTVTFRVAGKEAHQSIKWESGELKTDYDLTIDALPAVSFELTMAVNPVDTGTATDRTNSSPYAEGVEVSIRAEAAPGYRFLNWSAPTGSFADATARQTTFTMPDQDVTVTANFAAGYTLTMAVAPADTGTATDLTAQSAYDVGDDVRILAQPAEGYRFVNWTAPAGSFGNATAANTTFTMPDQSVTVTANFADETDEADEFTLTMAAQPLVGGILNPSVGTHRIEAGQTVTVQVVAPTSGYQFLYWMATPAVTFSNANAPSTSFTMPGSDVTVTAMFTQAAEPIGGCFIATAAYGTPSATQIDVLREFRDSVLLASAPGSRFVDIYYRLSPPVADLISGNNFLRTLVREFLVDPAVWLANATGDIWRS